MLYAKHITVELRSPSTALNPPTPEHSNALARELERHIKTAVENIVEDLATASGIPLTVSFLFPINPTVPVNDAPPGWGGF